MVVGNGDEMTTLGMFMNGLGRDRQQLATPASQVSLSVLLQMHAHALLGYVVGVHGTASAQ